jgi:hypothetical protein
MVWYFGRADGHKNSGGWVNVDAFRYLVWVISILCLSMIDLRMVFTLSLRAVFRWDI